MYQIYQVMPNDTVDSIAQKVGITSSYLRKINGMSENMNVRVGTYIVVPQVEQSAYQTYIVKQGDNLYSIARTYGVDYNTLILINGLNEGEYIYPNQEIIIPMLDEKIYIVRENDTLNDLINNTKLSLEELMNKNKNIFLLQDQVIKY